MTETKLDFEIWVFFLTNVFVSSVVNCISTACVFVLKIFSQKSDLEKAHFNYRLNYIYARLPHPSLLIHLTWSLFFSLSVDLTSFTLRWQPLSSDLLSVTDVVRLR